MRALYSLNIFFYGVAIKIASLFNAKAKLWVKGRKNIFVLLQKKISVDAKPVAWFHCASLGEFEQGRPLIESFKKNYPAYKIVLTFFSPSGYEVRKNYPDAEIISYLPLDTPGNAKRFLEIVNPSIIFFVKYEFWLNHLSEISRKNIPHILISAIFRDGQIFFKPHGKIFRDALNNYSWIFTQEENSIVLLKSIGISNLSVAGDTRFDRVTEIASSSKEIAIAKLFSGDERKVIVAGSTWPADEKIIFPAIKKSFSEGWKLIIAPHELGQDHLHSIEKGLLENGVLENEMIRFSKASESLVIGKKVLIIDNVGMLSSLYRYGKIAYVGGGFGKSIHNILEAAVYGMPVLFGPKHEKFYEAKKMLEVGGGICITNEDELKKNIEKLCDDPELLKLKSVAALEFVSVNSGATKIISEKIASILNH